MAIRNINSLTVILQVRGVIKIRFFLKNDDSKGGQHYMKNRMAIFFSAEKISLARIVFIITIAVMLAAIVFGLLMLWAQPPYAASITFLASKS
jgi:hypothetical protein